MSTATLSETEKRLYRIVSAAPPPTIADVIERMEAIDALLPAEDGLKWFNRLYLMVTQEVDLRPPNGAWQSPVWLTRLDVVFADLYSRAVAGFLAGEPIPQSWSALFESRMLAGTDRIQFAMAGMNAHINHDLALALIATNEDLKLHPGTGSRELADYNSVNNLLNTVMPSALTMLAVDTLGVLAQDTGKVGRVLAFWDMCRARELAWDFANHLSAISGLHRKAALTAQDSLTGVIGRALLAIA